MIIYRPHRGGLTEAMQERQIFQTEEEMKQYIYEEHKATFERWGYSDAPFEIDDIVIEREELLEDERVGWHNATLVCVKRYGNEDYMEKYGCPQCIGTCATDFPHIIFGYLDKLYFVSKYNGLLYIYDKISGLRIENPSQELLEVAKLALDSMED